jgi:hypothetical protein
MKHPDYPMNRNIPVDNRLKSGMAAKTLSLFNSIHEFDEVKSA